VGFLANEDPAAIKYAEWTAKSCAETGVEFELRKVDKQDLEQKIDEANEETAVNGIMVYYPVFGGKQVKYG
jgi:methylenetetrahydrofolate dehydrogenase (NAD+)